MTLLFIPIIVLIISYLTYRTAFYYPKHKRLPFDATLEGFISKSVAEHIHRISHIMAKYPYEAVSIESFDGKKLHGRYYHLQDGAPLEILMHGYRSHPYRDCAGGHALSRKLGFNALVVDQRAHGDSDGNTITFGIKERRDCLNWINWANDRFGSDIPIILCGLSMGASTVLMSADLDLPENVACIIADSPYSSPAAIIEKVCADRHYPVRLCRPFLHLGALLFGGFRLHDSSAKDSVRKTNIPIMLIHGEADDFVPCTMSKEIAANCAGPVVLQTFPDAGHGLCYITDPRRYERIILDFLKSIPPVADRISDDFMKQYYS